MTPAFWQALPLTGAIADLSDYVILRLTGPDAVRYLNGQVTQDVRKLRPGQALPGCVTTHKGKLEAFVHLTMDNAGGFLITAPGDLRGLLPLRLGKYLIADDCILEDLTETTALVHLTAPLEEIRALLIGTEHPAALSRFGVPGFDLFICRARLSFWLGQFPLLSPEDQSVLEVLHAVPAWGAELSPDLLPPEAGLDVTAIDYYKGCYIGQEVISRIRSVGRVNRKLVAFIQTEGPAVQPGFAICPRHPGTDSSTSTVIAGRISRTARHPLTGQLHALAFLQRGTPKGPLHAGPDDSPRSAVLEPRKSLDD